MKVKLLFVPRFAVLGGGLFLGLALALGAMPLVAVAQQPSVDAAGTPAAAAATTVSGGAAGESRPVVIFVRGAVGSPEYGPKFAAQQAAWKKAAERAGAAWRVVPEGGWGSDAGKEGSGPVTVQPGPAAGNDAGNAAGSEVGNGSEPEAAGGGAGGSAKGDDSRMVLEKILTDLPKTGSGPVWIVLVGHGTWDGKEARFNLAGPDLSAADLAGWVKPLARPLVVVNTSAASSPFMNALSGAGRMVITATRSGSERNYARFGEEMTAALEDPASDYDEDGQVTVLELFLRASSRTTEFYLAEGRIQTEHALIDDNGDGKGTPAQFFRGLRANVTAKDKAAPDGARARLATLVPDAAAATMTAAQLEQRDLLEKEIESLRAAKATLGDEVYYAKLEEVLRRLAELELGRGPAQGSGAGESADGKVEAKPE